MSNTYHITKVSPCPNCSGDRWILNPAWEQYYDEFGTNRVGTSGAPTQEELEAWFRNHGYQYPPDEEVPCWVCEGKGEIVTETTLKEALEDIGIQRIHQNFDERLLYLESDIKAIPLLLDRIEDLQDSIERLRMMVITEVTR